jgi:lipid II:glycine glycyltransferase (peptidoglycan interpeptide bridge formation enzyme)
MASVHQLDPLNDPRWMQFLQGHPHASVFHTPEWMEALRRTYGYEPVAFTHSAPGAELQDAIVFCRVKSWLTGCRMVSLPFSDHCQPLLDVEESFPPFLSSLKSEYEREKWKYLEIRPLFWPDPETESDLEASQGDRFHFHRLDLEPDLDSLFRGFHKSCIQRKIRRAERENLTHEEGRSESLLDRFYRLVVRTRRRQQLPPQPFGWFRNLADCLGDRLTIRLLSKDGQPVASILTLAYKETLVYKYGCSDERFHNLGGMPLLFWETIQRAKAAGLREFDLGRSELGNEGLVQFKGHLGATCSSIRYYRYPAQAKAGAVRCWASGTVRSGLSHLPDWGLVPVGKLLYKHLG